MAKTIKIVDVPDKYQRTDALDDSDRLWVHREGEQTAKWMRPSLLEPTVPDALTGNLTTSDKVYVFDASDSNVGRSATLAQVLTGSSSALALLSASVTTSDRVWLYDQSSGALKLASQTELLLLASSALSQLSASMTSSDRFWVYDDSSGELRLASPSEVRSAIISTIVNADVDSAAGITGNKFNPYQISPSIAENTTDQTLSSTTFSAEYTFAITVPRAATYFWTVSTDGIVYAPEGGTNYIKWYVNPFSAGNTAEQMLIGCDATGVTAGSGALQNVGGSSISGITSTTAGSKSIVLYARHYNGSATDAKLFTARCYAYEIGQA